MERVVFVEVLNRRGDVVQRVRLTRLPASIGRAWTNDVILADPHVDAQHARLVEEPDATLALEDLGSVNGLHADGRGPRAQRLPVGALTTVRLGRTLLRIATADQPVPAAIRDAEPTGPLARLFASRVAMVAVLGLGLVLASVAVWLSDYEAKGPDALAGSVLGLAAGVVVWAGIWAFAGRLIVHQARFWQHATLACLFFLAMWIWGVAGSWASFLLSPGAVDSTEGSISLALVLTALVLHAGLASAASMKKRILFSVGLMVGLGTLAWVGEKATKEDYGSTVAIPAALKPAPASMVPAETVDRFVARMSELKRVVDRLD